MIDPAESNLFVAWTDPTSAVTSYILQERVAPLQQSFYFVNESMTRNGRYLWFYCAFPPSGSMDEGRSLGLVDFQEQQVHHFAETQFSSGSPWVDIETGEVYWCTVDAIWRRGPHGASECVNCLPEQVVQGRSIHRLATHLSRSSDGKRFFIDARVGLENVFGTLPVDGGDFELWSRIDRHVAHAQLCPTDSNLVLFAQERMADPITRATVSPVDRLWMLRRGEQARPVFDQPADVTHEWWDADGRHVWCVCDKVGIWRVNLQTQAVEEIAWPGSWHSHADKSGRYLVGDANERFYRGCPSTVHFLNRNTGKHLCFAAHLEMPGVAGARYHIDPHPRFCCADRLVVYTTVVRGRVEVAMVKTEDLIDRTS